MHPPPLLGVGVVDLLESDPRPTFVVALQASLEDPAHAEVVYSNPALARKPALSDVLVSLSSRDHTRFRDWITAQDVNPSHSFQYSHHLWTRNTVLSKWVVVSSNDFSISSGPLKKTRLDASRGRETGSGILHPRISTVPSMSSPEFLEEDGSPNPRIVRAATEPPLVLPEFMPDQEPFLDMVDSIDWSATPLGPMDRWPSLLHQSYSQILCNSQPTAIYWGSKFTTVYNEAYGEMIGARHPDLMGHSVTEVFPEIADQLTDMMKNPGQSRRANNEEVFRFFVKQRDSPPLETYLKWSIVPVVQNNECLGFIHLISDTTLYHLFRRRIQMLVDMGEELGTAKDVKSYWSKLIEELSECDPAYDIPLAMLYSIACDGSSDSGSEPRHECNHVCRLEGALGVPENHPIMPETLRLKETDAGLAPQFRAALRSQGPLIISTSDGSLSKELLNGLQWRGFGDACEAAIVLPIRPTKEEEVMGLLVLGLNPRRPYDDAYTLYIQLLAQKLATSLACTVLLEEERRRGRNAAEQAAYDQAMLKEKLAYQTKEATEYTRLFQSVSDFIPNGFSIGDHQGNITFANSLWYRITGYPDASAKDRGSFSCVLEADREKIREAYKELRTKDEVEFEFRVRGTEHTNNMLARRSPFKADLYGDLDDDLERHVMAQARAERATDGTIIRTFTCLTDITAHKRTADEATRRAQQAENLKRMAELATVGMFDMDTGGRLLGANNVFFELCGINKVDPMQHEVRPWELSVVQDDLPNLSESVTRLVSEKKPQTAEIRLKTTWTAEDAGGNQITAPRWVNATLMPVCNSDGIVQSFTGCVSDVSLQKWQLELETQRTEEAIDSKRQQDNFIDMTSHEMRNPLSAIVHCSDAIIASLARCEELVNQPPGPKVPTATEENGDRHFDVKQLLSDSIENAETIVACAQHQKRIVDDILTMSKLDSKLLAVTPCTVNPVQIGEEAIKMFDVEARRVDIDLKMTVDKSYKELGHVYLDLDPSRVKQVLINLLTNALKFTKSGSIRNVSVCMKASRERPTDETSPVTFIPRSCKEESEYEQPALDSRTDPVYIMFEVKDTGQGLSEDEKSNLFNRFVQASSRTHVKYGGSGLGLFISRRLTELQKGAIGVASLPGVGSTFAFFIEAYLPTEASRREAESAAAAVRMTTLATAANTPLSVPRARPPTNEQRTPSSRPKLKSHHSRLDGILVVEDNLINQQITRRGLQDRGYTVDVANHGIEALERLMQSMALQRHEEQEYFTHSTSNSRGPPVCINMILMDIEMPVQDGLTCTRRIRELEREGRVFCGSGGRIPIIAVSANARPEQMQDAKNAGCDDVLVKPYRMPELIEKMQVVVRRMGGLLLGSPVL
ncbi:Putative PAS domain, signal transduction response regulator, receiver domain, CheY-like superfamily [Colletotrichum destructivum]|uniref:PAS domain, signal transduction response regulator, receiver domain, CheY-like superfamily n=1 Tax=Colletotrichum destructivum TaxID=34406 RepID=A0AAX4IJ09_9PEZI|nr:Putative PAS domain, signal transduction response regulator, receiver domain, CheY-like superfamily [Colletotrichum destructivum]